MLRRLLVLKTVDGETRPGVRIPLPPPSIRRLNNRGVLSVGDSRFRRYAYTLPVKNNTRTTSRTKPNPPLG